MQRHRVGLHTVACGDHVLTCLELKAPAVPPTDHPLALSIALLAEFNAAVRALIMEGVEGSVVMNDENVEGPLYSA